MATPPPPEPSVHTIKCANGDLVKVPQNFIEKCLTIKQMFEVLEDDGEAIPVPAAPNGAAIRRIAEFVRLDLEEQRLKSIDVEPDELRELWGGPDPSHWKNCKECMGIDDEAPPGFDPYTSDAGEPRDPHITCRSCRESMMGRKSGKRDPLDHSLPEELEAYFKSFPTKDELYEVYEAADFLDYKVLCEYIAIYVASLIQGKTTEEIRAEFGIENDMTPEEEDQLWKDYAWQVADPEKDAEPAAGKAA